MTRRLLLIAALCSISIVGACAGKSSVGATDSSIPAGCGDGQIGPGEECDDGTANSDTVVDACRTTCTKARCGDGVVDSNESCEGTAHGCMTCQISCPGDGTYCGGDGVGGDPAILYHCASTTLRVQEVCTTGVCQAMPVGVPDQCKAPVGPLGPVPQSLLHTLGATPYVEGNCTAATYPGWPFAAKRCSYDSGGLAGTVIVADPSAEQVGKWIMDASKLIPALDALKTSDPGHWEAGLSTIASISVVGQSSRIFPLEGDIIEDQNPPYGPGNYERYRFTMGVTSSGCTGCYCRINSMTRTTWCNYQQSLGHSFAGCISQVSPQGSDWTPGWGHQCMQNHIDAWMSDSNASFRAKAFGYNNAMGGCRTPGACSPAAVVAALKTAVNNN